jgi:5-formyltetrahydrofolate cyclo-ligase
MPFRKQTQASYTPGKAQLRAYMRKRRRAVDPETLIHASRQLCEQLSLRRCVARSRHIALYLPNDGEISPLPLIRRCWRAGKAVYLPVVEGEGGLVFRRYKAGDRLASNRYGIDEPGPRATQCLAANLDLVLLPLVAFDRQGGRLGMGGGYYDRSFRGLKGRPGRPLLLGAAYSFQELDRVPVEHWDRQLDGIVTEAMFLQARAI